MNGILTIVGKILSRLTGVLLGVAGVIAVTLFLLTATGTARFVPVLSNSMAPDMPKGSLAIVTPTPAAAVEAGDVIVFTAPDKSRRPVIHRVTHRYGPEAAATIDGWNPDKLFLTTAGDNNPGPDPWILVLDETFVWEQHTVIPYAGWPVLSLSDPTTRMIAFGAGGALIVTWAMIHIWRRPTPTPEPPTPDTPPVETTPHPAAGDTTGRTTTDTRS